MMPPGKYLLATRRAESPDGLGPGQRRDAPVFEPREQRLLVVLVVGKAGPVAQCHAGEADNVRGYVVVHPALPAWLSDEDTGGCGCGAGVFRYKGFQLYVI